MLVKDFTSGEANFVISANQKIGNELYLEMPKNTRGVAQCTMSNLSSATGATVKLQGRVNSTVDWIDVDSGEFSALTNTTTTSTLTDIQLYPQMRAVITLNPAAPTTNIAAYVTIGA